MPDITCLGRRPRHRLRLAGLNRASPFYVPPHRRRQDRSYPGDEMAMNSERTQAYGRVVRTLADMGPTKLHDSEQDRIREAADTLIFAATLEDARAALEDVDALCEHLVATDRWTAERAAELAQDVLACGPL